MDPINRRDFLKIASIFVANLGLSTYSKKDVFLEKNPLPRAETEEAQVATADALFDLATGRAPVLWLHGLSCSGCSVSFLNSTYPDPASVLTRYISLGYNSVVSAASGELAMNLINQHIAAKNALLVVEGAVPSGMPSACMFGEERFTDLLTRAASSAKAVIALGTCASYGGIPGAPSNPTGAEGVKSFFAKKSISTPTINIPGCPSHPEWLVGTLVHLLKFGMPTLTDQGCPEMFFGNIIHSRCPEFYSYNLGKFAKSFGEEGCLFELGCLGIRTYADCSSRRWNNKVNWCIGAGGPCIGCTQPEFAQRKDYPFYRTREKA
jgi:hydrogenase small subunit